MPESRKPSQSRQDTPPQQQPGNWDWRLVFWILVMALMVSWLFDGQRSATEVRIAYSEFKQAVRDDRVQEITIKGENIHGQFKETTAADQNGARRFRTIIPSMDDPDQIPILEDHGVTIQAETTELSWWLQALVGILPGCC
ncbi:MAG: ATP-dependent metallopeptidase FtsH/Yme1/Tma family protein [Gammaproteobacteria bacterium]|nr:ATP-dependent metallopeptidase FtsH/Yme1/Tma family protein [Gammaproteobacteria bacterium]